MTMIHEITARAGRYKAKRRKGRGRSSGRGKTCGRGTKGAKARVGKYIKPTYEGGQTELFRRFPVRGFSNDNFRRNFYIVNLSDLNRFEDGSTVDQAALIQAGLVPDNKLPLKILGQGEIGKKLTVQADWYSRSAYDKIIQAGGTALNSRGKPFEFPKPKKKFEPREATTKKSRQAEQQPAAEVEKKD